MFMYYRASWHNRDGSERVCKMTTSIVFKKRILSLPLSLCLKVEPWLALWCLHRFIACWDIFSFPLQGDVQLSTGCCRRRHKNKHSLGIYLAARWKHNSLLQRGDDNMDSFTFERISFEQLSRLVQLNRHESRCFRLSVTNRPFLPLSQCHGVFDGLICCPSTFPLFILWCKSKDRERVHTVVVASGEERSSVLEDCAIF